MTPFLLSLVFLAAQPAPPWLVATVEGTTTTSILPEFDFSKIVSVSRSDRPRPPWPTDPHVVLANGDRIVGAVVESDERTLTIENPLLGKVRVPVTAVAAIWKTGLPAGTPLDPMTSQWLADRKTDAVRLANGDVLRGTFERFGDDLAVWLKQPGNPARKIDPAKTVAVCFSAGLSRVRIPKVPHALVVLKDGSRVTVDASIAKEKNVGLGSLTGFTAFVTDSSVDSVTVLAGRAVDLAELKPKRSVVEPFLGATWPVVSHRSAKGNPLRLDTKLGVSTYDRGLGTHAKTTLEYDLAGVYRRFEAVVGLDATTGRRGRVPVSILVDGKLQAIAGLAELTAEAGPVTVSVDLTNAKSLTLVVDFGPLGDSQADVNWCEARLIEK